MMQEDAKMASGSGSLTLSGNGGIGIFGTDLGVSPLPAHSVVSVQAETSESSIRQKAASSWSHAEAFSRHRGLLGSLEQAKIRASRVAIAGMGGVGGIHLMTLTRLGIGAFHIADPDEFEVANFNRQYGATLRSVGRSKAEVMAEEAMTVNPELNIRVFREAVSGHNVGEFLSDVDVVVDGLDFFNVEARRLLFSECRRRGIWAVTAGPIGFSTAWLTFSPEGMSFDRYFDLHDGMSRLDALIAFAVGLTPGATHLGYMDLNQVDPLAATGPSVALACDLAAGVVGAEILKVLLQRGPIRPAPWYHQFDAYRHLLRQKRMPFGNRHPWQRLKRWYLKRRFRCFDAAIRQA